MIVQSNKAGLLDEALPKGTYRLIRVFSADGQELEFVPDQRRKFVIKVGKQEMFHINVKPFELKSGGCPRMPVKKIAYTNNQVTETTVFVYDASSRLVAEYSTILNETPQVAYLTNDHLGSPRINTNENLLFPPQSSSVQDNCETVDNQDTSRGREPTDDAERFPSRRAAADLDNPQVRRVFDLGLLEKEE
ncbi:MAG: hypothetical protein IPK58_11110 [Acidobacteria bacterium]|nr:hypothetical protein [Acidobacteriota bacterium]